jgi:hypothetical protein
MFAQEVLVAAGLLASFFLSIISIWKSLHVTPKEVKMVDVELSQRYNDLAKDAFNRAKEAEAQVMEIRANTEVKIKEANELVAAYKIKITELENDIQRHDSEIVQLKTHILEQEQELAILRKKVLFQDVEIIKLKEVVLPK